MTVEELQHFTLRNAVGGVGENVHNSHIAHIHHHFEGAGVEKITHQHTCCIAPDCVGSVSAAAQVGTVNYIIM